MDIARRLCRKTKATLARERLLEGRNCLTALFDEFSREREMQFADADEELAGMHENKHFRAHFLSKFAATHADTLVVDSTRDGYMCIMKHHHYAGLNRARKGYQTRELLLAPFRDLHSFAYRCAARIVSRAVCQ